MATTTTTTNLANTPFASWKLRFLLSCLVCFTAILSSVEGNTILYPVSEDARAERLGSQQQQNKYNNNNNSNSNKTIPKRQPGAPSRYLEYEGPDATYSIRMGTHPTISYPNLEDFGDTEIRIKFLKDGKTVVLDDCPRHFLWLSDRAIQQELDHKFSTGSWSERVLVEKTYFTLFYGGTGLASQYMDSVDDFQTDLVGWEIMNRSSNHCDWEGIECIDYNLHQVVVSFQINGFSLEGTLPSDLYHLSHLQKLDLHGNRIQGSIPASWGSLRELTDLDLADNRLTGELPETLQGWTNLQNIVVFANTLQGEISKELLEAWTKRESDQQNGLETLDLSQNRFRGKFPMWVLEKYATDLETLDISENAFTGILGKIHGKSDGDLGDECPPEDDPEKSSMNGSRNCLDDDDDDEEEETLGLHKLENMDLSLNYFKGHIPSDWLKLPSLRQLFLSYNELSGSIPRGLWMASSLERLHLSHNQLTGAIPTGFELLGGGKHSGWSSLSNMRLFMLDNNQISGTIPNDFLEGLGSSLEELNLRSNKLVGSLPSSIAKMAHLAVLNLHGNRLTGKLPHEMNQMYREVRLNLTDNLLIGTVPKLFCGGGAASTNLLFRQFGCDAILCPAGTFHPNGAASLYSGCRPCPIKKGDDPLSAKTLGQMRCGHDNNRTTFIHGDLNGDGELSEREVLRLLYTYTLGPHWGLQFENWADTTVDKCDLNGVVCVDGKVAKLDLTDAFMCTTADRKLASAAECKGIPAEIGKLTKLEIFTMSRRPYMRGTLPTEIGQLTNMKYLDVSSCPIMSGALPSEIGRLTDLKYLNVGGCRFNGTIPEELFELEKMEKLHLSMNAFTGTLSSSVEKMTNLKELLLSRTYANGTIPEGVGELAVLENFEMYGNQLVGPIPESLGRCTNLKRIDLFNNKLTGTIPESLADIRALQILHIKLNRLSGTISSGFGKLPNLSWFDVSTNHLHGTIPESFGHSKTLKDFRLGGGNMIHNPVPKSLCSNTNINGGLTKSYGCSGVICPLGTYSDPGHATHSDGCKPCPQGRTTTYLGSSRCIELTDEDILTMFYDVMAASNTFPIQEKHWSFDREGPICTWNGVECDENETIESIWFPLLELNADIHEDS